MHTTELAEEKPTNGRLQPSSLKATGKHRSFNKPQKGTSKQNKTHNLAHANSRATTTNKAAARSRATTNKQSSNIKTKPDPDQIKPSNNDGQPEKIVDETATKTATVDDGAVPHQDQIDGERSGTNSLMQIANQHIFIVHSQSHHHLQSTFLLADMIKPAKHNMNAIVDQFKIQNNNQKALIKIIDINF